MYFSRAARRLMLCLPALLIAGSFPDLRAATKPYRIAGAERGEDKKWRPVEVMEKDAQGVHCQIKYLDPDSRREVIAASLGTPMDLFPGVSGNPEDKQRGYLVFVLEMSNRSPQDVTFNPGQARLTTEKGDHKFALDYSAVYERVRALGPGAPEVDDLAKVLFDRVVTIRPQGSARKLLVFEAPREDRYKTLDVRVVEVNVGTDGVDFIFPFRKFFD